VQGVIRSSARLKAFPREKKMTDILNQSAAGFGVWLEHKGVNYSN
jgi:hypothetical protein